MGVLKFANGYELNCLSVAQGRAYPFIYIYTNDLTMAEACEVFDKNADGLHTLTYTETIRDEERVRVFEGYTWFVAVRKDEYVGEKNVIRIHIEKPPVQ